MKTIRFLLAALLPWILSSCTVNRTLSYQQLDLRSDLQPGASTMVAFQDLRSVVISGKEKKSFCGHVNSTAQIGYNIQTKDGLPLSTDFAMSLARWLNDHGTTANYIVTEPDWSADSIIKMYIKDGKSRLFYFRIHEWESRATPLFSTIRYEVKFEIQLQVFDVMGALLATSEVIGSKEKEEGMAVSMKKLQDFSDTVLRNSLEDLLTKASAKTISRTAPF